MLGRTLKEFREEAGLTQEELASKANVHRTYVSLLERDKKSPTIALLFRICDALGVPPSVVIARIEKSAR